MNNPAPDKEKLEKLLTAMIKEEKSRKSQYHQSLAVVEELEAVELMPKGIGLFEHLADVVVNWLLRKFFPSKTVMPKSEVAELGDLRAENKVLRKDVKAYDKITTNLKTLMNQGDYNRSFETLSQMSARFWRNMTPEAYKRLIETPNIKACDHRKGFTWRSGRRPLGTVVDYNIWDHTFVDGRREVRCLNHCGWKSNKGDSNWPVALVMLQTTSNTASASEQPMPHRDPDGPQVYPGDTVPEKSKD